MTVTELSRSDRAQLIALLEGKLRGNARTKLLARIGREPTLAEAWERLQSTRSLLKELGEAAPPEVSFRQIDAQVRWRLAAEEEQRQAWEASRRPWRFAAVASAALVLGAIAGVILDRSLDQRQDPPRQPLVSKTMPAPAVKPAARQTPARALAALALVVKGEVKVASTNGALERLSLDRPLLPGDRILTSADGRVTLQWADGTGVLLGADSELELRTLTDQRQLLALQSGAARFVVKPRRELPAAERDRRVEVRAGNLRVRVVGTRFAVALSPDHTAVEVSKGSVRAMPYDPKRPAASVRKTSGMLVSAGQRLEVPRQGGKPRLVDADDASLRRPSPYLLPWRSLAHVLAHTGRLRVDSRPVGAELRMDSVWVGQTNLLLRGSRGRHLLELWRDGKRLRRHWVQIGHGKPTRVALQLDMVRVRRLEKARLAPAIYRIIRRRAALIRACYERRLKLRPRLSGTFELRFEIGRDGRVKRASVDRDTLADPLVGRCAESAVKRWRFPPGNPATLVYPFVFKPR